MYVPIHQISSGQRITAVCSYVLRYRQADRATMPKEQTTSASKFNPEVLFDKSKVYFNHKIDSLQNVKETVNLKDIKNKLDTKELSIGNADLSA